MSKLLKRMITPRSNFNSESSSLKVSSMRKTRTLSVVWELSGRSKSACVKSTKTEQPTPQKPKRQMSSKKSSREPKNTIINEFASLKTSTSSKSTSAQPTIKNQKPKLHHLRSRFLKRVQSNSRRRKTLSPRLTSCVKSLTEHRSKSPSWQKRETTLLRSLLKLKSLKPYQMNRVPKISALASLSPRALTNQ